jgi:hypothetical protein
MPAAIKRIVLDASVAVAWCFEDENSPFTEGVLDLLSAGTEVLTPAIWPFELANALLLAERRKRITVAQVTALLRPSAQTAAFGSAQAISRAKIVALAINVMRPKKRKSKEASLTDVA